MPLQRCIEQISWVALKSWLRQKVVYCRVTGSAFGVIGGELVGLVIGEKHR